jgi:hypothetical protein
MRRFDYSAILWLAAIIGLWWLLNTPHGAAAAGGLAQPTPTPTPTPPPGGTGTDTTAGGDVTVILAPVLLAATSVERALEILWSYVESVGGQALSLLRLAGSWVSYTHQEYRSAEQTVNTIAAQARAAEQQVQQVIARAWQVDRARGGPPPEAERAALKQAQTEAEATKTGLDQQLDDAEKALADAQTRLQSAFRSPAYVRNKQIWSVGLGIILGIILAFQTGLDMFALLHLPHTPLLWHIGSATLSFSVTMFITGIIVGTGSGPVHSLIGLAQETQKLFTARRRQGAISTAPLEDTAPAGATAFAAAGRDVQPEAGTVQVATRDPRVVRYLAGD